MNGQWITYPGRSLEKNLYFRTRRQFTVAAASEKQLLHIAAESYYQLWLNGHELGIGPARGSRSLNYYDTYEVNSYLCPGTNHIAVLVQCMNIPNFNTSPCCAGVCIELENIIGSDDEWEVLANDEWPQNAEILCPQAGFTEFRDLRQTPSGWQNGGDCGQWRKAEVIGNMNGKKLLPRPIPVLTFYRYLPVDIAHTARVKPLKEDIPAAAAVTQQPHYHIDRELTVQCRPLLSAGQHEIVIVPPEDGSDISIVFNFGREVIGFFHLELSAPAGTLLDLAYDEELADGRVNASRAAHDTYRFSDRYIMRDGHQEVGTTIHERGFRFVEVVIRNFREPVTLHTATAVDRRYPLTRTGSFNCSDMLLNRIWDVCIETMSACTTDVFNDCPWRERAFWVNDLMIENIVALQAFGDYRLNSHALRLAMSNIRTDGLVPGVCPDDGKSRTVLIPANLFLPLMLKDYYLYSGDRSLVDELLPVILTVLKRFELWQNADSLLMPPPEYWNFFDWSFELNKISMDGKNTSLLNWLYVYAQNTAASLLEETGQPDKASACRAGTTAVIAGIEKHFWSPERNCYADWLETDGTPSAHASQLAQAFALLSGSLPESRSFDLIRALNCPDLLQPELYLQHFVLNAMRDCRQYPAAINRIRKYWGEMIKTGTPTLWEAAIHQQGKAAFGNIGSLCHGFGSTPINYFQTAILGVVPLEPGFGKFAVNPVPHDLDFAEGRIPTPAGSIHVRWRRNGTELNIELTVPCGLTAQTPAGEFSAGKYNFEL